MVRLRTPYFKFNFIFLIIIIVYGTPEKRVFYCVKKKIPLKKKFSLFWSLLRPLHDKKKKKKKFSFSFSFSFSFRHIQKLFILLNF